MHTRRIRRSGTVCLFSLLTPVINGNHDAHCVDVHQACTDFWSGNALLRYTSDLLICVAECTAVTIRWCQPTPAKSLNIGKM